jgi:Uma2 family endonuclease
MAGSTITLRRWTRAEYERMIACGILGEDEHVQLIAGEIVMMAPQNSPHFTAITLSAHALQAAIPSGYYVRSQGPLALGLDSEPEPDIAVVAGAPRDYRDQHPSTARLIVEISDTTLAFDRQQKGSLYARAGIQDYWILNLSQRTLEVHRSPVADPSAPYGHSYSARRRVSETETVTPLAFPDVSIAVADLLP